MVNRLLSLSICAVGLMLAGCATITRGGSEVLVIESEPSYANATLSSGNVCTTPCVITMKRTHDYHVKIEKVGYQTVDTDVLREVAGAGAAGMAGNVLLGGLIGVGVDLATGATMKLTPNPLHVQLEPIARPLARSPASAIGAPAAFTEPVNARNIPVAKTINLSPMTPGSTRSPAAFGAELSPLSGAAFGWGNGYNGARVKTVALHGIAAEAGIQQGDILLRVGDTGVNEPADVQSAVGAAVPGSTVEIELMRNARFITVSAQF
jgi:membrane-associated protease RseP (regulator of RpoE activity)